MKKTRVLIMSLLFCLTMLLMPKLQVNAAVFAGGTGTASNPYKIATPGQFNEIRNYSNKYFVLTNNIDLSQDRKTLNWQPIKQFSGVLDGKGYTVKNLYVEQTSSSVGLIVEAKNAVIKNMSLTQVHLVGKYTAGLVVKVADKNKLTMSNCKLSGTLTGSSYAAGLVGQSLGETNITNVTVEADIKGGQLAGIMAEMHRGRIAYATYKGNLTKTTNDYRVRYAGGIVARFYEESSNPTIESCTVDATFNNVVVSGGIVGYAESGTIKKSSTQGTINGYGGGILGETCEFNNGTQIQVTDCINKANITSGGGGGIVGRAKNICIIKNCTNYGNVTGRMESGGIAGELMIDSLVENCVNYGNMEAFDQDDACGAAGGLVGRTVDYMSFSDKSSSKIINSISFGTSTGNYAGTVCGVSGVDFMFIGCYYSEDQKPVGRGSNEGIYRVGEIGNTLVKVGATQSVQPIYEQYVTITPVESKDTSVVTISGNKLVGVSAGTADVVFQFQFDGYGKNFSYQSVQSIKVVDNGFAGGEGTKENPYQIKTVEHLNLVNEYPNAYYRLMNDINLLTVRNYVPMGSKKAAFTGGFDGQNYCIRGLTLTRETEYAGLFGLVCNATIKNIKLDDAYITTGKYAGGIAGYAYNSNIDSCIVNGEIAATSIENNYAGLIVGYMSNGKLNNCCGLGNVKSAYAGVFAGYINTVATNCYWYQADSTKGVGVGTTASINAVKKIDLGISNLVMGENVGNTVAARASVPTTNFKLYGTPTKYSYKSSSNTSVCKIANGQLVAVKNGNAMVNVTVAYANGKSINVNYKVTVKKPLSKITVSAIPVQNFTNASVKPKVVVKDGTKVLTTSEYTVTYSNNKNPGKASATITGKGSYSGTKTVYFTIRIPKLATPKSSVTSSTVSLTWKQLSGVDGYEVFKYSNNKATTVKEATYKHSKLSAGKSYKYKVRAYKVVAGKRVYGAYSNVVTAITKLKTPTLSLKAGKSSATAKWNKISGAKGYELQMSSKKTSSFKRIKKQTSSTKVSYTKTKLKKGKTYYFRVRAYKVVNGKTIYSNYSKVKSVKIR